MLVYSSRVMTGVWLGSGPGFLILMMLKVGLEGSLLWESWSNVSWCLVLVRWPRSALCWRPLRSKYSSITPILVCSAVYLHSLSLLYSLQVTTCLVWYIYGSRYVYLVEVLKLPCCARWSLATLPFTPVLVWSDQYLGSRCVGVLSNTILLWTWRGIPYVHSSCNIYVGSLGTST